MLTRIASGGQLPSLEPRKLIIKINKIYTKYENGSLSIITPPNFNPDLCEILYIYMAQQQGYGHPLQFICPKTEERGKTTWGGKSSLKKRKWKVNQQFWIVSVPNSS